MTDTVTINGEAHALAGRTVADVLATLGVRENAVAVAINAEVIPRAAWRERRLDAGDRVEIVAPRAGG